MQKSAPWRAQWPDLMLAAHARVRTHQNVTGRQLAVESASVQNVLHGLGHEVVSELGKALIASMPFPYIALNTTQPRNRGQRQSFSKGVAIVAGADCCCSELQRAWLQTGPVLQDQAGVACARWLSPWGFGISVRVCLPFCCRGLHSSGNHCPIGARILPCASPPFNQKKTVSASPMQ